ncbi:MAG: serine/threonine protein kinase [Planctomycetota bacterium]|jgi:serine/threonine-protein kinase
MSRNASETGEGASSPVAQSTQTQSTQTQSTQIDAGTFVQEFQRLVEEGWEPSLDEFLHRVPENLRDEVFSQLDGVLEEHTEKTWKETSEFPPGEKPPREGISILSIADSSQWMPGEGEPEPEPAMPPRVALELEQVLAEAPVGESLVEESPVEEPAEEPDEQPEIEAEFPEEHEEPQHEEAVDADAAADAEEKIVAGYRMGILLGEGTLGQTFFAKHADTEAEVALKAVPAEFPDRTLKRLTREATKISALSFDRCVALRRAQRDDDCRVLVTPYVAGDPIDAVAEGMDFADVAVLLRGVLEALATAHAANVPHLDLKPANVLVTPEGEPRILEFGLGVAVMSASKRKVALAGLGHYESPEHAHRSRLSSASDIFSFGSLMYRVLTGQLPFPGGAREIVQERIDAAEPALPRLHDLNIPQGLQDICLSCLSRKPAERPDAGTLIASFDRFLRGRSIRLRPAYYKSVVRRGAREIIAGAHGWQRQGLARDAESERIESVCNRVLAREEQWTHDSASAPRSRAVVGAGAALFVLASGLIVHFGYARISLLACLLPSAGALALLVAGLLTSRRGERALATPMLAGGLAALAPATLTALQHWGVLDGAGPIRGLSWLQICVAAGASGLGAIGFLAWRRDALFAWIAWAASIAAYVAGLGATGFLGYGAIALLPLAALLGVAYLFESRSRFDWMTPFFWTGVAALTVLPLHAAATDALRIQPGVGIAFVGVIWLVLASAFSRTGSLALRDFGRWLAPLAPGLMVCGLLWHAAGEPGATEWLALLGVAVALCAHGLTFRHRGTFGWGLFAVLCGGAVAALQGLAAPWTLALALGGGGLVAAIASAIPRKSS